jgi:bifunctional non-homologous end joining protein LigD
MKLADYRAKRRFTATAEPRGRVAASKRGRSYVVQKHDASHLHYDLRLEHGGVLLSWALPKGPSLDPREKRLAVRVEDHPVEYGRFEGTIPAGQYGGGTVLLWDRGTWRPHGDPDEGLRSGKLAFTLAGEKLAGDWTLVRMRSAGGPRRTAKSKENWLLIKSRDAQARPASRGDVLKRQPLSVTTGRDLDEIAAGKAKRRRRETSNRPPPRHPRAQLATLVAEPPTGDDWLHEIKFDGYRMLAVIDGGRVTLRSRNDQDWTRRMARLAEHLGRLPVRQAVLDGEVVVLDPRGVSRFQLLQNALGDPTRADELIYCVFDLLHLDGRDLRELPLSERKTLLRKLLPRRTRTAAIRFSDHQSGHGDKILQAACRAGLEGVISKRRDAPYRPGRGRDWLKSKCGLEQELVIGGYTDPAGSRRGFGALLLGYYDGPRGLTYAGRVGTGFDDRTLKELAAKLKRLQRATTPFERGADAARGRGVHWVEPTLVAQVKFAEWTHEGLLRQASFVGLRLDKPAEKVVRERAG